MITITCDGNTAAARIAYAFSDAAAIYPITPSTPMAESCDAWSAEGRENLFGQRVRVVEMQSEAGAAGALHGAMAAGALTTTFTASQGLLLMLPNMCKLAGELTPAVFHVSARALSYHALSIFGDHSDVMAVRTAGFAMLASGSVQLAADLAAVAHMAALETSVPMLHFFDGFRTSHEVQKIEALEDAELRSLCPFECVEHFRARALNPEHPHQQGTAQNPDIYFQGREAANRFYQQVPQTVQRCMDQVAAITGRSWHLFDYEGAPDADRVLVMMGSGGEAAAAAVQALNAAGEKTGVVHVRLYRPFDVRAFAAALPRTVRRVAVLDRTKESGAVGEPLYLDVVAALKASGMGDVTVVGGRYGLGSKEFAPAHARSVLDMLREGPVHGFTVGIEDDVTGLSLPVGEEIAPPAKGLVECLFYGIGSDGTVGANKNAIRMIAAATPLHAQAYFAYDSKKSGGLTVSHLRFGPEEIRAPWLIRQADVVACHQASLLKSVEMAQHLREGGVFLLNCSWGQDGLEAHLPGHVKRTLARKRARICLVDAAGLSEQAGLGRRINTVMQWAFFRVSGVLPMDQAEALMRQSIIRSYAAKGDAVVQQNLRAIDLAAGALQEMQAPESWLKQPEEAVLMGGDGYYERFIRPILTQKGDELPTSMINPRGFVPTGTSRLEKRGVASRGPKWLEERCIQCGMCAMACPHACLRPFCPEEGASMPEGFVTVKAKNRELAGRGFRIQLSPMDCTGCGCCVDICPARGKALELRPIGELLPQQQLWEAALTLPEVQGVAPNGPRGSQLRPPLLEFSGACAGCGETPYIKLATQLFGDRMIIANATGCSSIYGGSAPTCPYTVNQQGRGPAWASSLFEDNAEFGLGMQLALRQRREALAERVQDLLPELDETGQQLCRDWLAAMNDGEVSRAAGDALAACLKRCGQPAAREILKHQDLLCCPSVWIIGGDGWAYDIGFGGLDHVLASGENVNVLVLDTEVYSNTGGQASKATPAGAVARFAAAGKEIAKKDLGLMAISYGHVYVAQVSMGADPNQLHRALLEAERYPGPSLIIAYAPCIAHGGDMSCTQRVMKQAVQCGYWTLYRYHPDRRCIELDSREGEGEESFRAFLMSQGRFAALMRQQPERGEMLLQRCWRDARIRREALLRLNRPAEEVAKG